MLWMWSLGIYLEAPDAEQSAQISIKQTRSDDETTGSKETSNFPSAERRTDLDLSSLLFTVTEYCLIKSARSAADLTSSWESLRAIF